MRQPGKDILIYEHPRRRPVYEWIVDQEFCVYLGRHKLDHYLSLCTGCSCCYRRVYRTFLRRVQKHNYSLVGDHAFAFIHKYPLHQPYHLEIKHCGLVVSGWIRSACRKHLRRCGRKLNVYFLPWHSQIAFSLYKHPPQFSVPWADSHTSMWRIPTRNHSKRKPCNLSQTDMRKPITRSASKLNWWIRNANAISLSFAQCRGCWLRSTVCGKWIGLWVRVSFIWGIKYSWSNKISGPNHAVGWTSFLVSSSMLMYERILS